LEEPYFEVKWFQGAGQLTSSLPFAICFAPGFEKSMKISYILSNGI